MQKTVNIDELGAMGATDSIALGEGAFITEAKGSAYHTAMAAMKAGQVSFRPDTVESDAEIVTGREPRAGALQKRDIVDMILVWEDNMNQLIYADKEGYFVYREDDETSEMVRRVTGGHTSIITTIEFSYHLSLIATGTETGEVGVWDYELS